MGKTTFSDLTKKECDWLQTQLDALPLFVEAFSPADAGQPVTLQVLDRVFAAWLAQDSGDNAEANAAINVVGIRFGQFLVDGAGFRWVIAADKAGSDLAVLALPGRGDVLIYPANFVAKRWEQRQSHFLAEAFDSIRRQLEQIQATTSDSARRPWWRFW